MNPANFERPAWFDEVLKPRKPIVLQINIALSSRVHNALYRLAIDEHRSVDQQIAHLIEWALTVPMLPGSAS